MMVTGLQGWMCSTGKESVGSVGIILTVSVIQFISSRPQPISNHF